MPAPGFDGQIAANRRFSQAFVRDFAELVRRGPFKFLWDDQDEPFFASAGGPFI